MREIVEAHVFSPVIARENDPKEFPEDIRDDLPVRLVEHICIIDVAALFIVLQHEMHDVIHLRCDILRSIFSNTSTWHICAGILGGKGGSGNADIVIIANIVFAHEVSDLSFKDKRYCDYNILPAMNELLSGQIPVKK